MNSIERAYEKYKLLHHPVCPHCGFEIDEIWDYGLEDQDSTIAECGNCGKEFKLKCSIDITYETEAIEDSNKYLNPEGGE